MGESALLAILIGATVAGGTAVAQGQQQEQLKAEQDRQRVAQDKQIAEEKAKMDKILKESLKESATDLFQCLRCKKRKTIYCEVQTRSSDEPMTKFITCLECGYKWKQY